MFIDKICICGFKNYKESIVYNFSDFSTIEGRNAQGKTSIAEAITWGLYGCDLNGDYKADSKLRNNQSEDMYVIIDFYYNGQSNRIVRKKSKSLTLKLNDEKISEKELSKFLPNKDLFLAIFNPKYFLNYNVSKQRELLLKMLPKINSSDIIEKFNLYSISSLLEKYPTVNDGIKSYSSQIKSKNELIKEK
ncbi:MAG: AAA family ATPase, partial [Romboutsia sp.]|nr:AAA family ATPase [Romboutsia sp.]